MSKLKIIGTILVFMTLQSCGVIKVIRKKIERKKPKSEQKIQITTTNDLLSKSYEKVLLDSIKVLQKKLDNSLQPIAKTVKKPSRKFNFLTPIKKRFIKSTDPITKPYKSIVFEKNNSENTNYTYRKDTLVVSMSEQNLNELMLETLKNKTKGFAIQVPTPKDSIVKTVEVINSNPIIKYDTLSSNSEISKPITPTIIASENVLIGDVEFDTDPKAMLLNDQSFLINFINSNSVKYSTFKCTAKVHYKTEDKSQSLVSSFRLKQDSAIWVSANIFPVGEVLRSLVLKDSAKAEDKFNHKKYAYSTSELEKLTNIPLQFIALQNFIIGNSPVDEGEKIIAKKSENGVAIRMIKDGITTILVYAADSTLQSMKMYGIINNKNILLKTSYRNYENTEFGKISTNRSIDIIVNKKETQIEMEIKKYKFNEILDYPYSVNEVRKDNKNEE